MNKESKFSARRIPLLGLASATCGIFVAMQFPASASTSITWSAERIAKDAIAVVGAGIGASISTATYLPLTATLGPTIASGLAGSAGFTAGGGTKIAGDYLVDHPKTSLRTLSATVITGDLASLPNNLKVIVKNVARWFSR